MGKAADFVTSQGFAFLLYNENRKVLVLIMKELLISIVNGLVEDKEAVSLIGTSARDKNETDCKMWYLDGDNNFKLV